VSRRNRDELEQAAIEELRGWQTDQDLFDQAAADFAGLNRTDTRCLDIIERHGPMTAGQLAAEVHLTTGAVTAVVDRLERLGLVERTRDTVDRRRVLLEVTPAVAELMAPVFGPLVEGGRGFMARYSDEEIATLFRFLRENRAILSEHTTRVHGLIAERRATTGPGRRESG
jgi:DNA-binding MarR family transcriptional regulator